jgi:GNAT superfamily N-acetyltransferase
LRRLLFACFPHEPVFFTRRFVKLCPQHRWLVFAPTGEIVAHAAMHDKTLGTAQGDLAVVGIAEVCVASKYRGRGLAKELLETMHAWLRERGISHALLFGQPKVYASRGYVPITNELRADNSLARHWNPFCGKPLVKLLGDVLWPTGMIDLRGPTF